jgi:Na+/phosphate symporter
MQLATIVWPLVFAIAGALVYAFATNGKLQEMGRLTFFIGMFWLCYSLHGAMHI